MNFTKAEIDFFIKNKEIFKHEWEIGDYVIHIKYGLRLITHTPNKEQLTIIDFETPNDIIIDPKDCIWLPTEHDLRVILEEKLGFNNWFDVECCFMDYCDKPDNLKETELLTLAEYALKLLKRKQ